MQLVKRFELPGELLKSLDVSVMVQWMTERRRDCLSEGLQAYRQQPLDLTMQTWLDGWIERTQYRGSTSLLAPLMDNRDDWNLLSSKGTGCFVYVTHNGVLA